VAPDYEDCSTGGASGCGSRFTKETNPDDYTGSSGNLPANTQGGLISKSSSSNNNTKLKR